MDEKYNGWTNYETWLMNLNITNDEGIYNEVMEIAKHAPEHSDAYDLGEQLKTFVEETFYKEECEVYKICDVWTERDFQQINWQEIAESLQNE